MTICRNQTLIKRVGHFEAKYKAEGLCVSPISILL